jgi:hypothetical protein
MDKNNKKPQENISTKEELLSDIEALISYGKDEPTIAPELLRYLETEALISIKRSLLQKAGVLSEEDKLWLVQFKKYD